MQFLTTFAAAALMLSAKFTSAVPTKLGNIDCMIPGGRNQAWEFQMAINELDGGTSKTHVNLKPGPNYCSREGHSGSASAYVCNNSLKAQTVQMKDVVNFAYDIESQCVPGGVEKNQDFVYNGQQTSQDGSWSVVFRSG